MIIGFTGTSKVDWPEPQRRAVMRIVNLLTSPLSVTEGHHGDCIRSDAAFHGLALERGWRVIIHPPTNPSFRAYCDPGPFGRVLDPWPYLERNQHIVEAASILVATPAGMSEERRSGTWATIRAARRLRRSIFICWPNGFITRENPQ